MTWGERRHPLREIGATAEAEVIDTLTDIAPGFDTRPIRCAFCDNDLRTVPGCASAKVATVAAPTDMGTAHP